MHTGLSTVRKWGSCQTRTDNKLFHVGQGNSLFFLPPLWRRFPYHRLTYTHKKKHHKPDLGRSSESLTPKIPKVLPPVQNASTTSGEFKVRQLHYMLIWYAAHSEVDIKKETDKETTKKRRSFTLFKIVNSLKVRSPRQSFNFETTDPKSELVTNTFRSHSLLSARTPE